MDVTRARLGDVAKQIKRVVSIQDDLEYRTLGCHLYGAGVYQRETKLGSAILGKRMFLVSEGDLVINRIWAQKGAAGIVAKELAGSVVTSDFPVLEIDRQKMLPDYLGWYLKTPEFWQECARYSYGTSGRRRLNPSRVLDVAVPFCSLGMQAEAIRKLKGISEHTRAIGREMGHIPELGRRYRMVLLDRAFRGQLTEMTDCEESAEALLARILQRKDAEVRKIPSESERSSNHPANRLVGPWALPKWWVWTTVADVSFFMGSGSTPLGGRDVYVDDGFLFIRSQNVSPDGLQLDDIARIPPEIDEEMSRTRVKAGDVLLNITGASIGRSTYVPDDLGPANVNQHVCIIRTNGCVNPVYLSSFLNSPFGQKQIMESQSGATREGLNYRQVGSILLPLAPLAEQASIGNRIQQVMSLIKGVAFQAARGLSRIALLEQSALTRAFQGKILPVETEVKNPSEG